MTYNLYIKDRRKDKSCTKQNTKIVADKTSNPEDYSAVYTHQLGVSGSCCLNISVGILTVQEDI